MTPRTSGNSIKYEGRSLSSSVLFALPAMVLFPVRRAFSENVHDIILVHVIFAKISMIWPKNTKFCDIIVVHVIFARARDIRQVWCLEVR